MATALETLVKAVRDLDHANSEVHLKDGRIMREVAAVVASADEEQVVLALKVLKKEPCAGGLRGR